MNLVILIEESCREDYFSSVVFSSNKGCKYFSNLEIFDSKKNLQEDVACLLAKKGYEDYRYILLKDTQIENILNKIGCKGLQIDDQFVSNDKVWKFFSKIAQKNTENISEEIFSIAKQLNKNKQAIMSLFLRGYLKETYHNIRISDVYVLLKLIKKIN
ncbi:hypothetical protein H6227_002551 [Enterococcus faecalis]|nr:hypothetical protein [Enterococcus faecalis]